MTPERQLLSDLLEHTRRLPAHFYGEWEQELGRLEGRIESVLGRDENSVCLVITDAVQDEHYALECRDGCPIRGYGSTAKPATLEAAASIARFHAVAHEHTVNIIDARVVARRMGEPV